MSEHNDAMLQEAIQAIEKGETSKARDILTRLLRTVPNNPEYWVWLSAAVESPKERRYCLQKAYAADPSYEPARRGLILLGELPPEDVAPVRVPKPRAWEATFKPSTPQPQQGRFPALPRPVVIGVVVLFVLAGLSWGAWGTWQHFKPVHLPTPQLLINTTRTPTPRPKPSPTPINPLTLGGATPLVQLLRATYTPTPVPFSTPHLEEAYRLGQRAMAEGRWDDALRYFEQVAQEASGKNADVFFYIGEVYRHLEQPENAIAAYQKALKVAPHFAPAKVGIAQALLTQGKTTQAQELLTEAIQDDPEYGPAYLTAAQTALAVGAPEDALAALDKAEQTLPQSPLLSLYRAEAYLALGDPQKAYEQAKQALDRDLTLLPAYKVLGEAALRTGHTDEGIQALRTYLTYKSDDIEAYRLLADAYMQQGNYDGALAAAKKVVEANPYQPEALQLLAEIYLARKEPDRAVEALQGAVRMHPYDLDLRLALTDALLAAGQPGDAFQQLRESENLLKTQEQQYAFYYRRAKVLTALEITDPAIADWRRVLNAPEGMVPDAWRGEAQKALDALLTPTAAPTSAVTPTPGG